MILLQLTLKLFWFKPRLIKTPTAVISGEDNITECVTFRIIFWVYLTYVSGCLIQVGFDYIQPDKLVLALLLK